MKNPLPVSRQRDKISNNKIIVARLVPMRYSIFDTVHNVGAVPFFERVKCVVWVDAVQFVIDELPQRGGVGGDPFAGNDSCRLRFKKWKKRVAALHRQVKPDAARTLVGATTLFFFADQLVKKQESFSLRQKNFICRWRATNVRIQQRPHKALQKMRRVCANAYFRSCSAGMVDYCSRLKLASARANVHGPFFVLNPYPTKWMPGR